MDQWVYRLPKKDFKKLAAVTIRESKKYRQSELARVSGFSPRHVSRLISGKVAATPHSIARLQAAINALEKEKRETAEILSRARQASQKSGFGNSPPRPVLTRQISTTPFQANALQARKCSLNSNRH